jgi:hypothetical protein
MFECACGKHMVDREVVYTADIPYLSEMHSRTKCVTPMTTSVYMWPESLSQGV